MRASLIDEKALRRALDDGTLSAASLNVAGVEPPPDGQWFYTHDRVRLTPHISWAHPDALRRLGDKVAANLDRVLDGEPPVDLVEPAAGY